VLRNREPSFSRWIIRCLVHRAVAVHASSPSLSKIEAHQPLRFKEGTFFPGLAPPLPGRKKEGPFMPILISLLRVPLFVCKWPVCHKERKKEAPSSERRS
jgi:hypothetical protein